MKKNIGFIRDRIRGVMYGVAVGDALGAPVEFMSADAIKKTHGRVKTMIGGGWLNVKPGEVTDDTQMTMCVAYGIVKNPTDPIPAIGEEFIRWYLSGPKDVGGTCASSISNAIAFDELEMSHQAWLRASALTARTRGVNNVSGNGTLMRTAFVPLYYPNINECYDLAEMISMMTHYDGTASGYCARYCGLIHHLVGGTFRLGRVSLYGKAHFALLASQLGDAAIGLTEGFVPKPTGYVVDSFDSAINSIATTGSFSAAVIKAVNLGGDADTIGAITGGLAGAVYGYEAIPRNWLNSLDPDLRREIDGLCELAASRWEEET